MEATKGLCDRPLETFAPCGGDSWKVAAALSAAVTTSNSQETALTLRRNQARRNAQPERQPLFGREGSGNRLVCSFGVVRPCELGASPIGWVVVTAVDRAAAPYAARGTNPSARLGAGTSPFRGGFAWRCAPLGSFRGGSQGGRVCGRGTSPLWRRPKGFAIALWKPSPPAGAIAGRSRRLCQPP